jgi:hypothetical protein
MSNIDVLDIIESNWKDLLYIGGAITTFFLGKKSRKRTAKKEEVFIQSSELDNVETALDIYRKMLQDLRASLKEAEEAYEILERRFQNTLDEKRALIEENIMLRKEINELKSNN